MKARCAAALICALALHAQACDAVPQFEINEALLSVGLTDPEPLPAVTIDALIDGTPGSPGASLPIDEEEVQLVAHAIADRPGSILRIWVVATASDEARVVYDATVPARPSGAWHSQADTTFESEVASDIGPALESALAAATDARVSPIASSIDRVLLADAVGTQRVLLILSDGRERHDGRNLECADVSPRSFRASLDRSELLRAGSIAGQRVRIEFAQFEMLALRGRGCRATVRRERAIRATWTEVLTDAGAISVAFRSGYAELNFDMPPTTTHAQEER